VIIIGQDVEKSDEMYLKIKNKFVPVHKHHAMKTYWGVEEKFHTFLTSALDSD
jgi:hypothetical protein